MTPPLWRPGWRIFPRGGRVEVQRPVLIRRRIETPPELLDETPRTWGAPEPLPVHAMAPGSQDPAIAGREAEDVEWTLYLPPGIAVSTLDRLVIDGEEYEVNGRAKDWGRGLVVEAKRREG